jgi:peptidoglycan/LPS O-acetylase OafA/YrhL
MGSNPEIPALTGLRGVAALLVVWAHYSNWCAPYPSESVPRLLALLSDTGGLAMSIFFTLSGFVISYHYAALPWREAPLSSLGTFAFLRFSRLYPALLAFIVISYIFRHQTRDMVSVQTWWPFSRIASIDGPLALAWSISSEVGMYLMFAGAMLLRPTLRLVAIAIYLVALASAVLTVEDSGTASWLFYLSPYFRFLEFGAGALLAQAVVWGLVTVRQGSIVTRCLSSRLLIFCGTISYSLYLFHDVGAATIARMLGLHLFGYVSYDSFSAGAFALFALRFFVALAIAIALAYVMFTLVEQPGRAALRTWLMRPRIRAARA